MQLEQLDRAEQRRAKAMWHAAKRKAKAKPLAPVEAEAKEKGQKRFWKWIGENITSCNPMMLKDHRYFAEEIRAAGFRLPKIGGKDAKAI